jgi:hypothetical protein
VLIYNHSLQHTIHNDNVNQFKVGLELDKGYFTLKVKPMTLMFNFFLSAIVYMGMFYVAGLAIFCDVGNQLNTSWGGLGTIPEPPPRLRSAPSHVIIPENPDVSGAGLASQLSCNCLNSARAHPHTQDANERRQWFGSCLFAFVFEHT